ncbi:uncharacterized protein STEHIDRAFT_116237 [Stereum hirsutum FP-91666 SS1]|uniref:Uncharacterized protein n=1 Tax=Stereum hirsutum (strain FP-91666) TaxID=721885 RepID=R7RZK6_STEHR|nr:uncharacterized protein STEHIDRAFT_116237 [Stereum hirsutum FP-91666 SS1]EIM79747.1 hypothetical protein STEHIDRAFT_116237 [Stereum hirsutum FP-91666 SS1]
MLAVEPSPGLYAQLFDLQFDLAAPKRRLDPDVFSSSSRQLEMKRRFTAMQLFKRGDVYVGGDDKQLAEAFGVAYIMLLEDNGTNAYKLKADRQSLLLPIVVVGSRYPIHLASSSHSSSTPFQRPRTITLPPLCLPAILSYVVRADCNPLNVPQYALNTRADAIAMGVNEPTVEDIVEHNMATKTQCLEHPQWDVPQSRSSPRPSSPLSHPQQGLSGAPMFPFNEYQPLAEGTSKSERQDSDWARLTSTSASDYNDLSSVHSSSDYSQARGAFRMLIKYLSSLCVVFARLVPCEDDDGQRDEGVGRRKDVEKRMKEEGVCKPEGWEDGEWSYRMNSSQDGIEVHTPSSALQSSDAASPSDFDFSADPPSANRAQVHDDLLQDAHPISHHFPSHTALGTTQAKEREVTEIVLTGRTPPDAARAWGDYDYFGKVRVSDGLVVLSRKPEVEDVLTFSYRLITELVLV